MHVFILVEEQIQKLDYPMCRVQCPQGGADYYRFRLQASTNMHTYRHTRPLIRCCYKSACHSSHVTKLKLKCHILEEVSSLLAMSCIRGFCQFSVLLLQRFTALQGSLNRTCQCFVPLRVWLGMYLCAHITTSAQSSSSFPLKIYRHY